MPTNSTDSRTPAPALQQGLCLVPRLDNLRDMICLAQIDFFFVLFLFLCACWHSSSNLVFIRKDWQRTGAAEPGVGCPPTFLLAGCVDGDWDILDVLLQNTAHGRGCGNQAPLPKTIEPCWVAQPKIKNKI